MAVAASEVVVGLGLIVAMSRSTLELDVDKLTELAGMTAGAWLCLLAPLAARRADHARRYAHLPPARRACSRPRRCSWRSAGRSGRSSRCSRATRPSASEVTTAWTWLEAGSFKVGLRAARRPAQRRDDADRLRRRRPDRPLLDRLHGRRRRGAALLRVHVAVRLLDADARRGRQLPAPARRLGPRRPRLVPADRLLARARRGGCRRQEGVHHERVRRRDDGARLLPPDPADGHAQLRPGVRGGGGRPPRRTRS